MCKAVVRRSLHVHGLIMYTCIMFELVIVHVDGWRVRW